MTLRERIAPILGSVLFLFVAPGIVAGLIPWWISGYRLEPAFLGFEPFRWFGIALLLLGAVLLIETFARFALQGRGTPAPIYPTKTLVITGSYRFVRNPMYVAVVSLIFGQALPVRQPLDFGLRPRRLAHRPPLRPRLRGTETPGDVRRAVRRLPRWGPALDPARDPLARLAKLKACRLDFVPGPLELGRDLVGVEPHVADNVVGKPREAGERMALLLVLDGALEGRGKRCKRVANADPLRVRTVS